MNMGILKKNKITFLVCAAVLCFGGLLYWIMDTQPQADQEEVNPEKLVEFQGSNLEEKKDGKLMWKLTADKIMVDPDTKIVYFTKPTAVIYDVDDTVLTIVADTGTVNQQEKKIEIKPPIQAQTDKGDTLQTDGSIYYDMDSRQIKGGKVLMKRSDNTELSGDSFETNAGLDHVALKGHAKVVKGE